MKKVVLYIASDETEFFSEKECMEWEYKISHLPASIHWYTKDGTPLVPQSEADMLSMYNARNFNHCILDDVPSLSDDLHFMNEYWGFIMPSAPGDWYWDKRAGWVGADF